MDEANGYLYLNLANEWPLFEFESGHLGIAPDGSLTLDAVDFTVVSRGVFRGGPFQTPIGPTPWRRLQVNAEPLPDGTHVQLFTFTADDGDAPFDPAADEPFAAPGWRAAPRDVLDVLIAAPPAHRLWIGGLLRSDGRISPVLHQMRVEYGRDSYSTFLPAIYRTNERENDFLGRFLSLHESMLGELEERIAGLPMLFDPFAAPTGDHPAWLAWLSRWLDFELNEAWSVEETRRYLAEAFQLSGQRGTVEGLRRYLKLYAGVEARIEEPGRHTTLWSLGETSTLGFTTMLAPAHLQGAVVGTSATLDQSHLTRGDDFGAALFEDVAHRFYVHVYCAELTRSGALADVQAVLEREKPAHTTGHLCVIEPRMRVGVQNRLGIDTVVAQGPAAAQIGMVLDTAILAAAAEECEPEGDR